MSLEEILLDLGIEKAKDKEDIQSMVAKAIPIFLQSKPVLSTIEIRKAIVRLADKGKIPFLGKEYGPAWPCNGTYSDSGNSYIKQDIRENKYGKMWLSEIVKIILEDKHEGSKIAVNSFFRKPRKKDLPMKSFSRTLVYYKEEEKVIKYVTRRLSDSPVLVTYSFKLDESWRV